MTTAATDSDASTVSGVADAGRRRPRLPVATWEIVGWLAAAALLMTIRLRLLDVPLERDEGLFAVIGRAILGGAVPYRDVFEDKPPGLFYVYALAVAVSPPTARGLHGFLLVWCVATSLVVALVARAMAGRAAGVVAACLFAFASAAPSVQGFSASSEMLLLLPFSASVLLALLAGDEPARRRAVALAFGSGVLAGVTFWIKQPAVLALAAAPVHLARRLGASTRTAASVAWVAGALAVTLAFVPLVVAAGWSEIWYWSVVHPSLYAAVPATARWSRLVASGLNVATDVGPAIAVGLVGSTLAWRRGHAHASFAIAFLALSVMSAFQSQFLYRHYFALLVPAAAAVGGAGLVWLVERMPNGAQPRPRVAAGAAVLALVVGIPLAMRPAYWLRPDPVAVIREALGDQAFDAAPMIAAYIREHTRPTDRIFVYGSEPEIAFLSARRDVNPFGMVYPLTWPWPRHREFQERVWAGIERDPPAYILLVRNPFSLARSPRMDPFLETNLEQLAARDYVIDAVLARDEDGRYRLRPGAPEPNAEPRATVFYELWRRRAPASG